MAQTDAQIRVLIGEELGLISGNEVMSADDNDKITRRMAGVRAWLIEEGLCYWASGATPDAAALPYAKVIASQCADVYGRGSGSQFPYTGGDTGFLALEKHCSVRSKKERVQSEYF